ncbi:C-X-C motif chemokine 9-like [Pyrgilauda ruficollis]|uniref:C-X-C motif chemokine 9-like n=1 Tax=Pyrgilauda ruficollis TaxID=221976 RepID=UPI001B869C12|nr:C-X-C motif chemokine 9-like [Pyrgilauda ruficollis]
MAFSTVTFERFHRLAQEQRQRLGHLLDKHFTRLLDPSQRKKPRFSKRDAQLEFEWKTFFNIYYFAILEVNGNLSCRCAKTTSEYISPKKYESIEIRPVGSSCRRTEIIIKLRTSGKVCVNPEAPWVKKLLKRIASTKKK